MSSITQVLTGYKPPMWFYLTFDNNLLLCKFETLSYQAKKLKQITKEWIKSSIVEMSIVAFCIENYKFSFSTISARKTKRSHLLVSYMVLFQEHLCLAKSEWIETEFRYSQAEEPWTFARVWKQLETT